MSDNIHKTHFPVTKEMPWHEKERQAVLLLKQMIAIHLTQPEMPVLLIQYLLDTNKELVDWVMKYKSE